MMNIMYRHIMYRGKNTSVPTVHRRDAPRHVSTLRVGVCRTHCVSGFVVSNIVVSGHIVHIACRGLLRQTLRAGVCRVEHCRAGARRTHYMSGFVVLVFVGNDEQRSTLQHYNNITTTLQKDNNQQPRANKAAPLRSSLLEAHCSLFSVFFPASNPQAAIISSPREARIVVIIPCDVR